ncbi:MAG: molybdopterin cofactor-binding domain-containing protein [Anaerolineae bacterium]
MTKNSKLPAGSKLERKGITRRRFLTVLGGGAAVLAVGAVLGGPTIVREARLQINKAFLTGSLPPGEMPKDPFVWFEISADNAATLYIPKVEMGQGIHTTLAQIAADELELDWKTVTVRQANTVRGFNPAILFTFGSTSVTSLYHPIREIAATMREMLRIEAASQLNKPVDSLTARNSTITTDDDSSQALTYGTVIASKQGEWVIPKETAPLKPAPEFRYIGQSVERVDLLDKVTGRAKYGFDMRAEGMVYGAVARPPRYGAILKSATAGDAAAQPGVVQVVISEGFAGIVATSRRAASAALDHLELVWEGGTTINQADIVDMLSLPKQGGTLIQREGNVDSATGTRVESTYFTPMAVHAQLEPQAALADVKVDSAVVYTSTQAPGLSSERIAKAIKMDAANVQVNAAYIGGGFGRKTGTDAAVEAAILSKAVGQPVMVGWTREEEMQQGYRRPPSANYLWATISDEGNITAIHHEMASGDVLFNPQVGGGGFLEVLLGTDPLAAYGGLIHYSLPNIRGIYHKMEIPVPTAYWRGLGSFPNTFAIESFMDELAQTIGTDPFDLRLKYKPDGDLGRRYELVLNALREASEWDTPPIEGHARGMATCYDRGTVVGLVTDVSVTDAEIQVHQAWCAVDPGLIINPNGAAAQVEGSIVMGLSSTLIEEQIIENGMATSRNFNTYPLLRLRQTPRINVIPINSGDEPVGGLGEPVIGAVPAAVANAVFALTGNRLRKLPLKITN